MCLNGLSAENHSRTGNNTSAFHSQIRFKSYLKHFSVKCSDLMYHPSVLPSRYNEQFMVPKNFETL